MSITVIQDDWQLQCGGVIIRLPSAMAAMAARDLLDKGLRAYNEMIM